MSSVWNFVKNYKKPILATAGIVGGIIGLRSYISSFEKQWQQSASRSFVSEVHKKGTYFDNAIEIGNEMANTQYRQVIKAIQGLFHIDELLNSIKEAKQNGLTSKERLTYFEKIKLEIFSFAVSEVYAIAFFITYMRVQLSITSGKMYNDSQKGNSTENSTQFNKDSNSSYSLFLHLLENFHQFGVENIVTHVRKVVEQCFNNIPVTEKVTLKGIVNLLEQVQNQMSSSLGSLIEENASIVFSTNKEHLTDEELNSNSRTFQEMRNCSKMIDEILDIVKISDFNKVIGNCTNIGFSNLYDFMSECFLKFEMDDDHQSSGEQAFMNDRQFINPNKIMIPLVKLLPEIWRQLNSYESRYDQINQRKFDFNDNKKNRNSLLVQYLLCSDSLTCFSANLYEAFCNEHEISNGQ